MVKKYNQIKMSTSGSSFIVILLYKTAFDTSSDFSRFKLALDCISCLQENRNYLNKAFWAYNINLKQTHLF